MTPPARCAQTLHPMSGLRGGSRITHAVRCQDDGVDAARVFIWKLHPDTREDCELTTASGRTLRVPYRPFCGVMGVAPPPDQQLEDGRPLGVVSTGPPNINGGNVSPAVALPASERALARPNRLDKRHLAQMDNRHMGEGSTCYYPVFVPGALFSCGDGHVSRQR